MDGCGWFGIYRHILFPFVRRELLLIILVTAAGMVLPIWAFLASTNNFEPFLPYIADTLGMNNLPRVGLWVIASFIMALFPIVILFLAKPSLDEPTNDHASTIVI